MLLSPSDISSEYKRRYRELCEQYGAADIWQTSGLDQHHHVIWVVPRDEVALLGNWERDQYEVARVERVAYEAASDKAQRRQEALEAAETAKAEGRAEREAQRLNRPVFVGNDCRVCGERIEPTGKRGRPAVVHEGCKDKWEEIKRAEYERGRCQSCRHERHEGKTCGVTVIQVGTSNCQCEGEIPVLDMS